MIEKKSIRIRNMPDTMNMKNNAIRKTISNVNAKKIISLKRTSIKCCIAF